MSDLRTQDAAAWMGTIVEGFDPSMFDDEAVCTELQELFDSRGFLVFRGGELTYADQARMCEMLIRKPASTPSDVPADDTYYISNARPNSAAPHGRLQFHMDTAWSDRPNQIVSLYATELEQPATPTLFASMVHGYATMPAELRTRIEGLEAIDSADQNRRRGNVDDVLLSPIERPPWTRKPVVLAHPRTGDLLIYVGEQNTKEIVGMGRSDGEALLDEIFDHVYEPAMVWNHQWQLHDLVCWDNIAVQHARPNVALNGPARTLRKIATPMPALASDELPVYVDIS